MKNIVYVRLRGARNLIEYDQKDEIPKPERIAVRLDSEYTDILARIRILEGKNTAQVIRDALDCLEANYSGNLYPTAIK